ncbi:alpha-galactosidase [Subtercola sp. PAMC28395]|uniref:alpha-galactosidase n=1 Tax=Subtercola sp. PAMC28395 TaxID=2846775 RepID=UPI00209B606E|nr:alpha-galactosidase [Subtercola sp. PAMC28395]
MPHIVHWGAALGVVDDAALRALADSQAAAIAPSSIDAPPLLSLLPLPSEGWGGQPGLTGHRISGPTAPSFTLVGVRRPHTDAVIIDLDDRLTGLAASISLRLSEHSLLHVSATVTNTAEEPFELGSLRLTLPLPDRASEVLDFSGYWSHERQPQRRALAHGSWSRQNRHGRTGHDSPLLSTIGTPGFGFRHGQVWGIHLAFSGDQEVTVEALATGQSAASAGELLRPGEIRLASGESYSTPGLVAGFSSQGLDAMSAQFHAESRAQHQLSARPVVLNTWEAVYFDHRLDRLVELAELGARVGVERFVLDDGWMTGRTDDRRALGDWTVDRERWPNGLHPLVSRVHELGMDFGLWIEPEMVSLDSDLAHEHPDWVLRDSAGRLPQPWRHQYALDLGNPAAFANILAQLCALLDEYPIAFFKWDQNRDLLAGSSHRQTSASYRLMDELRARYPQLEIESCSSGGGRVDLGVLQRTDRVWPSDTNDPLQRQGIQRFTSLLLPPELIGSHLGAATAHTTGRTTELGFRLATAFFCSAGIEWDLTLASEDELRSITTWIAAFKANRALLHSGVVVRADAVDPAVQVHGVVAEDRRTAVFALVVETAPRSALVGTARFPGLDPDALYTVEPLDLGAAPHYVQDAPPAWLARGSVTLSGRMLSEVGLPMPLLVPQQALVLTVRAASPE